MNLQGTGLKRSEVSGPAPESDRPLVILVDDDPSLREALENLLMSVGLDAIGFASPQELFAAALPDRPGCLVLDIRMPGVSGLDLQHRLAGRPDAKPIVFLTGHGDVPMSVQAMKAGAVDFLTKPLREQTLLDAIAAGIARDIQQRACARALKENLRKFALLSPRERQVLRQIADGRQTREIAAALGISEMTVKVHRTGLKRKMRLNATAALVRVWETLPAELRERDA